MNGVIIDLTERPRPTLDGDKVAAFDAAVDGVRAIRERIKNAPRTVDCSTGERERVILDADVALMLGQAFIDLANERRIVAMDVTGAEEINRAFQAIEKMGKALVE